MCDVRPGPVLACLFTMAEVLSKFHVARWAINIQAHPGRSWRGQTTGKARAGKKFWLAAVGVSSGGGRPAPPPPENFRPQIFEPPPSRARGRCCHFRLPPRRTPNSTPCPVAPSTSRFTVLPPRLAFTFFDLVLRQLFSFCKVAVVLHSVVDRSHFRICIENFISPAGRTSPRTRVAAAVAHACSRENCPNT
jgi:hypothetical protein